ncbi:MAG: TRAP transporter small permease subunit [Pseudomonadota bacterium]|nr:TRAP transporter small permease subunit [Pseudomonadota bacterium]MEE3071727.1 TRAP transporter small permease subunit [Pseudomonadota bacterium]
MKHLGRWSTHLSESVSAMMMAGIFLTFILQILIRYVSGADWFVALTGGFDTMHFGWTTEFIMVLWLWVIFWGNAFVVRDRDHVTFDIFYNAAGPRLRTGMALIGAVILLAAFWLSIEPTYGKMRLLRLKSSATLPVKMLPIYSVYFIFLAAVGAHYAWRIVQLLRGNAEREMHVMPYAHFEAEDQK